MHENRETSKTPAANLGRSAGEGSGHTARMHVSEESHRGIVPIEVDSPYALVRVLPLSSSPVCPRFLRPHRGFSCQCSPSLVERRELCRYTSGSAVVARLAPCPICLPSSPARYALGVGERCD